MEDDENTLVLVASDPHNNDLLLEIGKYVSYDVQFKVGLYQDIIDAIKEFYDPSLTEDAMQEMYDESPDMLMAERSEFEQLDEAGGFLLIKNRMNSGSMTWNSMPLSELIHY